MSNRRQREQRDFTAHQSR